MSSRNKVDAAKKAKKDAKKQEKANAVKAQTEKYKADKLKIDKAMNTADVFETFKVCSVV